MIWPDDSTFAFLLTIDIDGDLPLLAENPENVHRLKSRSVGLYGPEHGAGRLLRVLGKHGLHADWFIPGEIARRYPELVREIAARGHGIGVHGDKHLDFDRLQADEQIAEMANGRDAIIGALRNRPASIDQMPDAGPRHSSGRSTHDTAPARAFEVADAREDRLGACNGFRLPAGEWAPGFPDAMAAAGFSWSSSLPYSEYPFALGQSGLTEIPFKYELDDNQYLGFNLDPPFPPGGSRIMPLEFVEENWGCELQGAARYGTLLHVRLNAEVMGIASRARMLDRFLGKVLNTEGVWVASCDRLDELTRGLPSEGEHCGNNPYNLWMRLTHRQ